MGTPISVRCIATRLVLHPNLPRKSNLLTFIYRTWNQPKKMNVSQILMFERMFVLTGSLRAVRERASLLGHMNITSLCVLKELVWTQGLTLLSLKNDVAFLRGRESVQSSVTLWSGLTLETALGPGPSTVSLGAPPMHNGTPPTTSERRINCITLH